MGNLHFIQENILHFEEMLCKACEVAGRNRGDVMLIGVSKTHPIEYVQTAFEAGLRHFGENKAQELRDKASILHGQIGQGEAFWHFIGNLQRNKAKDIVRHADCLHSLDDFRLAETVNRLCENANRTLSCFVQINISSEATKSGIAPDECLSFLESMQPFSHLKLDGLMGIASPTEDEVQIGREFAQLRMLRDMALSEGFLANGALSMGMSDDFPIALQEGATHIRVGSAIFGRRVYGKE